MTRGRMLCCALLLAMACKGGGLPPEVSDTGYEGTWQRGGDQVKSTLAIARVGDEFLFRWSISSTDGLREVRCGWDGRCKEFVDGEQTSTYAFRTWIDESSGRLRVECKGKVERPTPLEIHYIDELVLKKEGLLLRSFTIEDHERSYEPGQGPRRNFGKISDAIEDPPAGWTPPRA